MYTPEASELITDIYQIIALHVPCTMFSLQFTQYKPNILSISINKESLNIIKYVAGIGAHSSFFSLSPIHPAP